MILRSDIPSIGGNEERAAGFTLIEMIVVLAILGLAMSLTINRGEPMSAATHARAAAAEILGALRAARSEAVMTNRIVVFTIDVSSRQYRAGQALPRSLPGDLALSLLTSRDQLVAEAAGRIRFNPDGSSSGGRVSVAGGNRTWRVGVDWLSGRVSLAEAH